MSPHPKRSLALTRARIEANHGGPAPPEGRATPRLDEATIDGRLAQALATVDGQGDGCWLFAYGSLMWRPEFPVAERRIALVRGYHRRFCLWQWRHRGSDAAPNLMLALDSGGSCSGVAYRIDPPGLNEKLTPVWRRELMGDGYQARWVTAETDQGPVRAAAFVVNRGGARYAGRLAEEAVADTIARARGHSGTGAEYLLNTAAMLEEMGLRDRMLWRMQGLVAARLAPAD